MARERLEGVREGDDAERNIGGWLWWICWKKREGRECGKIEGRRERKKLGGNYARLRVNSIESNESDVRDLIFKFLRIRKLCRNLSKPGYSRYLFFLSLFFFVSKEGECLSRRELKNFKKF